MTSLTETSYCLESNFIIDLLNGKPNAIATYNDIKGSPLSIASIALFEILRGEEKNRKKVKEFEELSRRLDVLAFGEAEAKEASQIEKTHLKGQRVPHLDFLIGITAKTNNTVLITNDGHYRRIPNLNLRNY